MSASVDSLKRQIDAAAGPARQRHNVQTEILWRLLRRDFSDAQSRRQMAWERQDAIPGRWKVRC